MIQSICAVFCKKQNRISLHAIVIYILLLSSKFSWDFWFFHSRASLESWKHSPTSTDPENMWSRICWCVFIPMTWNKEFFNFGWLNLASVKWFMLSLHASFAWVFLDWILELVLTFLVSKNAYTLPNFPLLQCYLLYPLFHLYRWGNSWDVITNLSVVGTNTLSYRDFFQASCSTVELRRKKRTAT